MSTKYDVIIVGAGIGGLVCGCYLAKAGLKILIVEQHHQPGGYCTSFNRKGYIFDVGVHYLGAGRKNGELGRLIHDLSLNDKIVFNRLDPCDNVIMPDASFRVRRRSHSTIEELFTIFKKEKRSIVNFFDFIMTNDFYKLYAICKNITFHELLMRYFTNPKIHSALSILLGNIGLPPSKVVAISAAALYREFILDPGYYPRGGMQSFSNALAEAFTENGGDLLLNTKITRIISKNNKVTGVLVEGDQILGSKYVVSNVDAKETFCNLLDNTKRNIIDKINSLKPTFSAFAVYLGVSMPLDKIIKDRCTTWYFSTYDIETCYGNPNTNLISKSPSYVVCLFPSFHDQSLAPRGKTSMTIFSAASFSENSFWKNNKDFIANKLIAKAEEFIPGLSNNIEVVEIATPLTFNKYTSNQNGALYGWACTTNQINADIIPQQTEIANLYLVGHWCTNGVGQGGISEVIYSGKKASKLILSEYKKVTLR